MKTALINGSPKATGSVSGLILQNLQERLLKHQDQQEGAECGASVTSGASSTCSSGSRDDCSTFHFSKPQLSQEDLEQAAACDTLVFAFPLYVDGIPSHLLRCLSQMDDYLKPLQVNKQMQVYAIVNCGFYEGLHNKLALDMMRNWCAKTGLRWGHGLGVGGGGMLAAIIGIPDEHRMKKSFSEAMNNMANCVANCGAADHAFIDPAIPRIAYRLGGAVGWRQQIKANGLKAKDLSLRK